MTWLDFIIPPYVQVVLMTVWTLKSSPILAIGAVILGAFAPPRYSHQAQGAAAAWGWLYAIWNAYMNQWWPGYGVFFGYMIGAGALGLIWFFIARTGRSIALALRHGIK